MKRSEQLPKPVSFLGSLIYPWSMEQTVREIARRMDTGLHTQHVVVNVAKIITMQNDTDLRKAVLGCDIINVDGMGVVWGARLLGINVPERVTGIDLFFRLLDLSEKRGDSVYLLGARHDVIEETVKKIRNDFPNLKIAGWHHGYFFENEELVVQKIAESGASMLFVAMTSPKKEEFIHRCNNRLSVKFTMGVGGTFDIIAGITQRAPLWMQKAGLEWFYRLAQEPKRMWKRYLVTNTLFLLMLLKAKFQVTHR